MVLCKLICSISNLFFGMLTFSIFKTKCGYGPHNPAHDVGCAMCGFMPNYHNATEHQTTTDFAEHLFLPSGSALPIISTPITIVAPAL